MLDRFVFFLLAMPFVAGAQSITTSQQKTLNNYVEYANKSAEEVTTVFQRIKTYYEDLQAYRTSKYKQAVRFVCPVQIEDYYYTNALKSSVGTDDTALKTKLQALRKAAEEIDAQCKMLDTYHKLEDYKTDDYKRAAEIITTLQASISDYRIKRISLNESVQTVYNKLQRSQTGVYATVIKQFLERINHEAALLNTWNFNLAQDIHTDWPVEKLKEHILSSEELIKKGISKNGIEYPASSMIPSFEEGLIMLQQTKRHGLDSYTYEAQQSDRHSNQIYLDLINAYNGVLISFYNSFVNYAQNNYKGLLALTYVPAFEIREKQSTIEVVSEPFKDIEDVQLVIKPQSVTISAPTFSALSNYIEFINEGIRQTDHLQRLYSNLSGSTNSYRDLTSFKGKGGLSFKHTDFEIPHSYLQKAISESISIPDLYRKSLNDQAEVLHRILIEMDQLSVELTIEIARKNYEKDNLKRVDEIIVRYKVIIDVFHEKKEILYGNVRKVFESYKVDEPTNSWNVSGKALLELTDADKAELFKAKAFYLGDSIQKPNAQKIQTLIRSVVSNEYSNLTGIEKIGRNNGNCPYTPYEDIPNDSKKFTEPVFKFSALPASSYSHPYHGYVYMYNNVVRSYNKFCELAKIPMLKTIYESELFVLEKDQVRKVRNEEFPVVSNEIRKTNDDSVKKSPFSSQDRISSDTIYIEKHDTIYIDRAGEDLRSMEGYATNNMVLLLDVSGSMNRADKLPVLKRSILQLLDMMREEDELSVVVFSGKPNILLQPVSFKDQAKIKTAIAKLQSKGTTDGNAAIKLAYEVADKNYIRGGNNWIVLATDGEFSITRETQQLIERFSKEDIFLSVFNFGAENTAVQSLEKISVLGKGNYEHIASENAEIKLIREVKSKRKK